MGSKVTGISALVAIMAFMAAAASYVAEHAAWIGDGDPEHFVFLIVGALAVGGYAAGGTPKRVVDEAVGFLRDLINQITGHPPSFR